MSDEEKKDLMLTWLVDPEMELNFNHENVF